MEIALLDVAKEGLEEWKKTGNKKIQLKIQELLLAILENPFEGIGKPEPLKHDLRGRWSRRITEKDRLVYEVTDDKIFVYSLKGHYE